MAGANEETGKGKGKGRVRATSGSSSNVATEPRSQPPGEMTPPTTKQIPHQRTPSGAGAMGRTVVEEAFRRLSEPVKAPRVKPTCVFAAIVAVLAVCRGILLPPPGGNPLPAALSIDQEDSLIQLVLAQELNGVVERIEAENRSYEDLLKAQAKAVHKLKNLEKSLGPVDAEMKQLELQARAVEGKNSDHADLTIQIARAQDNLRNLQRATKDTLGELKTKLVEQGETLTYVREKLWRAREESIEEEASVNDAWLETTLEENANQLNQMRDELQEQLEGKKEAVLSRSELESRLWEAAQLPSSHNDDSENGVDQRMDQLIRVVARDFIDRAVETTLQNSDISGGLVARGEGQECVSEEEVHELVEEAISRLDADGTGLADYANAAVGGSVRNSGNRGDEQELTSPTYSRGGFDWTVTGVESGIGPADSVISGDSSLGACWAMTGSSGRVTIQLSHDITVASVSVEHVSRLITFERDSAPKEFEVYGLRDVEDPNPVRLGSLFYDIDGSPIQTFGIEPLGTTFNIVQFRIKSNWGNPNYTCIYRLRVHNTYAMV